MNRRDYTPIRYNIYEKTREKIVYKVWEPGTILSEGELAKLFGTSRTPVREAIRQLETEGLVSVIPKKGILIPKIKEKDIEDISELLEIIHCRAITKAVDRVTPKDIKRLENIIQEAERYIDNKNKINRLTSLGMQFNELILKLAGNNRFIEVDKQIRAHLVRFTIELFDDRERRKTGWGLRKDILGALKKKDKKLAEEKMREFYRRGEKYLLGISHSDSNQE